jgi:glycosyltransferase involved in cell wall biosynthesis
MVGGAERWMRDLALRLTEAGHDVTYLTVRHWTGNDEPHLPRVEIVGLGRSRPTHTGDRRSVVPPFLFGVAVLGYLLRNGRRFDVVHTASFPYFPLLAAGIARRRGRYGLVVDWYEVWTRQYWRRYAGRLVGLIGWGVQRICVRIPQRAFCTSELHRGRLIAEGFPGSVTVLTGLYAGPSGPTPPEAVEPRVVYAGRHVAEKRVDHLIRAFSLVQREQPQLRLDLYGDGPERARVEQLVDDLGMHSSVRVKGHCPEEEVAHALAHASCMATASEREGYGLVVVEAAAHGTPSVIVAGQENAATELVVEGINGAVARTSSAADLANAILRVVMAGQALRDSTSEWFSAGSDRLKIEHSVDEVVASYVRTRNGND